MVPTSMGYATISGVAVQYGLYAAALGLIAFALFTTSKQVTEGPSSSTAASSRLLASLSNTETADYARIVQVNTLVRPRQARNAQTSPQTAHKLPLPLRPA